MIWLPLGMNPLKTKGLPQPFKQKLHGGSGGHFFSLFLDIDGQRLRLKGIFLSLKTDTILKTRMSRVQ